MNIEHAYLDLARDILSNGTVTQNRTGVKTKCVFGRQIRHDFKHGFPLLTTKKVYWKGVVEELLWFMRGETNSRILEEKNVNIWREWAREDGELGKVYGALWRRWRDEVDQFANTLERIKTKPDCRRLIVSSWDAFLLPDETKSFSQNITEGKQALPPCHTLFQFRVIEGGLYCQLYQRSADLFLGVPFNIASYALLTEIVAKYTNTVPKEFIHTFGDVHIYENHFDQIQEQLQRVPRSLPKLEINLTKEAWKPWGLELTDLKLTGYDPHPAIKAEVAV